MTTTPNARSAVIAGFALGVVASAQVIVHGTIAFNRIEGTNALVGSEGAGIQPLLRFAGGSDLFDAEPDTVPGGGTNIASAAVIAGAQHRRARGRHEHPGARRRSLLAPLADNGGVVPTMAIQNASPAIDRGDGCLPGLPSFDARGEGYPRVLRFAPDLGAYEYAGSGHGDAIFANEFEIGC